MSIFNEKTIKSIVDKASKDKTGKVSEIMRQLLKLCEQAGKAGFTLEELSIIGTTGWYVSQDPMMAELMKNMMAMPPPTTDDEFIN
tara:strand:+ start:2900 stop:3157 length:258 start_codon:yes stop_codon:yes gene_type:complete